MISVLESQDQVERICVEFREKGLTLHKTPQKNWDHYLLIKLLDDTPAAAAILDLGCGPGYALQLMNGRGFENIAGIDITSPEIKLKNRLLKLLRPSLFQPCFVISAGDICHTEFPDDSYDLLTCISVIEHGVDVEVFLKEAARLLRHGGRLFVSFDYWEAYNKADYPECRLFGLPWTIFNRTDVEEMLECASRYGLSLYEKSEIPPCCEAPVHYADRDYTFMVVIFENRG